MKKLYFTVSAIIAAGFVPSTMSAQSATDAYQVSQYDLKGTARFMSMAGAFGALGGDLSTLSQNPAGIGVYRSNELGFTLNLDAQQSTAKSMGVSNTDNQTKFYLNNIGGVATIRLNSSAVPNFNIGFTYNKAASFDRRYSGRIPTLNTSLSNYIAGVANTYGITEADVRATDNYEQYKNPNVPWMTILGYDAMLINPEIVHTDNGAATDWYGQFGNGTSGNATFGVSERGSVDEYNIAFGGNINNVVYWGMNFDIVAMDYRISSMWNENLQDAWVFNPNTRKVSQMDARWALRDNYRLSGTGFNYQLGVIVKPIQELRLGLAFHTPTFYKLTETFNPERIEYSYPFGSDFAVTNNDRSNSNNVNLSSPWKVIASVAGVIGQKFIVSADYEWIGYNGMRYSTASEYDYGYDYPWWDYGYDFSASPVTRADLTYDSNPEEYTNQKIQQIYKGTSTIRVGAEYRVTPSFSVRAGYSHTTSPVTAEARKEVATVPSAGIISNYRLDNSTNYVTCGLGYRYRGFYIDAAYVWKHLSADYYPFSPDPASEMPAEKASLSLNNSQVVVSLGFKF